jgi:hypothetical protein
LNELTVLHLCFPIFVRTYTDLVRPLIKPLSALFIDRRIGHSTIRDLQRDNKLIRENSARSYGQQKAW